MWLSVAVFLALFYTGHASENHPLVYFKSRNFQHVLHWERQNSSTGKPVLYSVQYVIYGHPWQEKAECQNITVLSCDLSAEMRNPHEYYYSRVTVNGTELGVTPRFRPMDDTVLGPPIVSVVAGLESLDLKVKLPTGPDNRTSLEDLITAGLQGRFIQYMARINSSDGAARENKTSSAIITFNHLKNNRKHCGTVSYTYAVRSQSEAFEFCVKTLEVSDPSVIIAGCLLGGGVLVVFLTASCFLYVKQKSRMPYSLNVPGSSITPPGMLSPRESISIIREVNPLPFLSPDKPAPTVRQAVRVPSDSPYAPQDCESWHCNSYLSQQGEVNEGSNSARSNSIQSSTNYSLVVTVQPIRDNVESHTNEGGHDPQGSAPELTDPAPISAGASVCPNMTSLWQSLGVTPAVDHALPGPLVVPRGRDGRLELSSLFSSEPEVGQDCHPSDADTGVSLPGFPGLPHRNPNTPSYCASSSAPSSGYRGNGLQGVVLLPVQEEREEREEREDTGLLACMGPEGRGEVTGIFLEGWDLQIQV
ncbi:hypothetical protein MATL_G00124830 [Megalops atlanticus]|uniref:Fibronectin type-III domain-containing protein n=1 Tax=Megalops atlanticus TaxID=7932 RepID=A0A9D3PWP8_MEGAT|nr:hypothetical protein MATL_G00124830 [Megalops atlanticus]